VTRFEGRTGLVTGAARGIGFAIAERLAREGARVALVDRDPEVEAVAKRLGARAQGIVADVTLTADVDRAVSAAHAWADRLDVVVNNAGITGRSYPIYGRIVNIASIAGKEGNPTLVPYSTAKAGVPI
jgi:NAD(P)-dependent dehydrogenase (short-subunit alcohol dehydrogenase family)